LARRDSPDPTVRFKVADRWPVASALVPESLWTEGIGNLLFARRTSDGRLACAVFLTDVFCLGVKDAMWNTLSRREFDSLRENFEEHGRLKAVSPEHFTKLIHRAVEYAQSLGFPPHRDFRHASRLLAGIDWSQCGDEFQFGQDGRPHYIRGPSESMDKARAIAARIDEIGGQTTLVLDADELFEPDFELLDEGDDDFEWDEFEDDEFEDDEFEDDASDSDEKPDEKPRRWSWLPWR
jgi:hypothetical protein